MVNVLLTDPLALRPEIYHAWLRGLDPQACADSLEEANPKVYSEVCDAYHVLHHLKRFLYQPFLLKQRREVMLPPELVTIMVHRFYMFDKGFVRIILGHKLSSNFRKDVDAIIAKNLNMHSDNCLRQFDNIRRIYHVALNTDHSKVQYNEGQGTIAIETPGVENTLHCDVQDGIKTQGESESPIPITVDIPRYISDYFCLNEELVSAYLRIIFITHHRFELGRRRCLLLSFNDVDFLSYTLLTQWTKISEFNALRDIVYEHADVTDALPPPKFFHLPKATKHPKPSTPSHDARLSIHRTFWRFGALSRRIQKAVRLKRHDKHLERGSLREDRYCVEPTLVVKSALPSLDILNNEISGQTLNETIGTISQLSFSEIIRPVSSSNDLQNMEDITPRRAKSRSQAAIQLAKAHMKLNPQKDSEPIQQSCLDLDHVFVSHVLEVSNWLSTSKPVVEVPNISIRTTQLVVRSLPHVAQCLATRKQFRKFFSLLIDRIVVPLKRTGIDSEMITKLLEAIKECYQGEYKSDWTKFLNGIQSCILRIHFRLS